MACIFRLAAEANAHHKAIDCVSGPNGMASKTDWDGANTTLGHVLSSTRVDSHGWHSSEACISSFGVHAYVKVLVDGADAEMA